MDSDVSWVFIGITYSMVKQRPRSSPTKTRVVYLSGSCWKVDLKLFIVFPNASGIFDPLGIHARMSSRPWEVPPPPRQGCSTA